MLESPAYRVLSLSAHRVISRIEIELSAHGGNDNGRLPVTKQDFIDYGISHDQVAPAIREAEALGFARVTQRGRGGNAEHRKPNLFFLTFGYGRDSRTDPPTHDWRRFKTIEEAESTARAARANKDSDAVRFAVKRAASKKPVLEIRTEASPENQDRKRKIPGPGNQDYGRDRKPGPLSIYRGGGTATERKGT
jgi:hypothetical protein